MIIQNNEIKISARFWPIFGFELSEKRSRAELKILQLELWLEPARIGLLTSTYMWCPHHQNCLGSTNIELGSNNLFFFQFHKSQGHQRHFSKINFFYRYPIENPTQYIYIYPGNVGSPFANRYLNPRVKYQGHTPWQFWKHNRQISL